jgi:hypothetical protein
MGSGQSMSVERVGRPLLGDPHDGLVAVEFSYLSVSFGAGAILVVALSWMPQ